VLEGELVPQFVEPAGCGMVVAYGTDSGGSAEYGAALCSSDPPSWCARGPTERPGSRRRQRWVRRTPPDLTATWSEGALNASVKVFSRTRREPNKALVPERVGSRGGLRRCR